MHKLIYNIALNELASDCAKLLLFKGVVTSYLRVSSRHLLPDICPTDKYLKDLCFGVPFDIQ